MNRENLISLFKEQNRAVDLAQDGQYEEAASILRTILSDFEELYRLTGESVVLMKCLATLASVTSQLQDVDTAIGDTERVIKLAESIGDEQRVQTWIRNLTKLYLRKGEQALRSESLDSAMEIYKQARELAKKTGDNRDEGRCLGNLATIYHMRGDSKLAIEFHKKALELFKSSGHIESYAMEYCNMANSYLDLKLYRNAYDIYDDVLANYEDKITAHTRYSCMIGIALCAHQLGDWSTAQKYYLAALDAAQVSRSVEEVEFLKNGLRKADQKQRLE